MEDDLRNTIVSALLGGGIAEHIQPCKLLWIPDGDSLEALGVAAGWFRDNGGDPDGDLLLAPADAFSEDELAAALRAGGKLVQGHQFLYPASVSAVGEVSGWCAYKDVYIGYALRHEVAVAVCAASVARAKD